MALELRRGAEVDAAVRTLREQSMHARNVASGGAGLPLADHVNRYLEWVRMAEGQLRNHFEDPLTWQELHSPYYWRIRDLRDDSPRPAELLGDEARRQAERLERLGDSLSKVKKWVERAPGVLAVLDTHVLLHFVPPEQVNWSEVLTADPVRLVIPLRVVEELDEKKYNAREDLADRARRLLSRLRAHATEADQSPIELRRGVVLDFYLDVEPRRRTLDADQEVLETCARLMSAGADVRLVTDDAGLELRARGIDIQVQAMPSKYLRKRG